MPRGTASVVAFAAVAIRNRDPNATMAVVTADHIIRNVGKFRELLIAAYNVAQEGHLVTLGITPTGPSTGYGYIQQGDLLGNYREMPVYYALRFKEKPSFEAAQRMLSGGDHSWNSGMFIWRIDQILGEIERQMPDLDKKLREISDAWDQPHRLEVLRSVWPTIQAQTIDYGIMEGAKNVVIIPVDDLAWSDVGAWDALYELLPVGSDGNISKGGQHIPIDSQNILVYTNQDRLIVTIGVDDLIVVDTGDVVLVCQKEHAQNVRQAVDFLKKNAIHQYL
jgi:mannose-1-phosphate guanylyltransferase